VSADALMALLVMLPLLTAVGAFAWPHAGRGLGLATVATSLVAAGWLAALLLSQGTQTQQVGGWSAPLGIQLWADGLSVFFLLVNSLVGLLVSVYAHGYFGRVVFGKSGLGARFFWPLWLLLFAGLNALFLSGDAFNLYVTLEIIGLSAVALVALSGNRPALGAALRYLFIGLSGSLLYLMGVALLYGGYGTVDLALLGERVDKSPYALLALGLMAGGLITKAALFPMHFWLPPAHSSAPAPVSALLSALVVKAGYFILLRLWFEVFSDTTTVGAAQMLGAQGAAAVLWGSIQALLQTRLKLLIEYSTVAQLGYLFLLFPLVESAGGEAKAWLGAMIFLLSHATAKAALFLAAGNLMRAAGHDRLGELAVVTRALPLTFFAIGIAGISLIGLPPSSGFVGKWLLLGAGLDGGQWWWVATLLAGSLMAAGYVLRVILPAFAETGDPLPPASVPRRMEWSALTLALISLFAGFIGSAVDKLLRSGGLPS